MYFSLFFFLGSVPLITDIHTIPKSDPYVQSKVWAVTLSNKLLSDLVATDKYFWTYMMNKPLLKEIFRGTVVDTYNRTNSYHYFIFLYQRQPAKELFGDFYYGMWCWKVQPLASQGTSTQRQANKNYFNYVTQFDPLLLYYK